MIRLLNNHNEYLDMIEVFINYYKSTNKEKTYLLDCIGFLDSLNQGVSHNIVAYMELLALSLPYGNLTIHSTEDEYLAICRDLVIKIKKGEDI